MITGKTYHRRPDPLLLLAAAVLLCAVMTTAATAAEQFDFPHGTGGMQGSQLKKAGVTVASMGHGGAGVSVSLTPPPLMPHGPAGEQVTVEKQEALSQVFLYLRYPW